MREIAKKSMELQEENGVDQSEQAQKAGTDLRGQGIEIGACLDKRDRQQELSAVLRKTAESGTTLRVHSRKGKRSEEVFR